MDTIEPFPLIEVHGDPRERGRQHGSQAADRVRASAEQYLDVLNRRKVGPAELKKLVDEFLPVIDRFDPSHVEEMRGIAEGAKIPLEHIVVINARRELLAYAQRKQDGLAPDGCTAAAVLPEAASEGILMHGQNWDWREECARTSIVLRIQRNGNSILALAEAGQLARCGFNESGIAITGNHLDSDRDYRSTGVPLPMIRRKALENEHYALAIRTVYGTEKCGSNNMLLSHKDGEAIDIECAPDESFLLHPEDGIIVHANHWESVAALSKLSDGGVVRNSGLRMMPDSAYRAERVRRQLKARRGKVSYEDFRDAFLDNFGSPYSVCRPPRPALDGSTSATVATILMRPAEGVMDIAVLPAIDARFTRYSLKPETVRSAAP
jgi:isopenicillin-N N-acyltransferase like protein